MLNRLKIEVRNCDEKQERPSNKPPLNPTARTALAGPPASIAASPYGTHIHRYFGKVRVKFVLEVHRKLSYLPRMSQTLEKRVTALERKVAQMSAQPIRSNRSKDWRRTIGVFRNDPEFEKAVQLGREYREQQTYTKEIAGS